jgi:CBS domain-containing protein
MTFTGRGKQLTIFISETDQFHHQALYMAIIENASARGMQWRHRRSGRRRLWRLVNDSQGLDPSTVDGSSTRDHRRRPPRTDRSHHRPTARNGSERAHHGARGGSCAVGSNDLLTRGGMKVTISLKRATDLNYVRGLHDSLENPHHKVSEVMTRQVVTITPDAILARAARLMVEKHLKRLPVVDSDGKLVGILGRLDILNTIAAVHLPQWHPEAHPVGEQATVAEVMTREVPTVHDSAIVEEIFELLVSSSHKRVVVVDDKRQVVGIIADSDLISR